jgi:adenylate cyclase
VGVGAHWGEAYCGAVGDEQRLEFTVLGDTVNVAARLQETSKAAGWSMVASRALLDAAGESASAWASLGSAPLRGRATETEILAWRPHEAVDAVPRSTPLAAGG